MARVLHVLKGGDMTLAALAIERQLADGDLVTVALTGGATPPALPPAVAAHRVPDDWSYDRLLEEIFTADHVLTW
jgi:hypothetical protein